MKNGVRGPRTACCRASRPTPASAGTRSRPAPGRASTARRTTRSIAPVPASTRLDAASRRPGILQADTLPQAAERAGKKVARARVGRRARNLRARAPGARRRLPHLLLAPRHRSQLRPAGAAGAARTRSASHYQRVRPRRRDAAGRTCRRRSARRSRRSSRHEHVRSDQPATGVYDLYIYDSTERRTVNYDHVLVVHRAARKNGSAGGREPRRGRVGRRAR